MTEELELASVLIVEDDALSRDMMSRRLTSWGVRTEAVEDAETCLERLEKPPLPDVLLVDIRMRGMGGIELTREIRKKWAHNQLPIIMVTGMSDSEDVIVGLEAGANDYIVKPVNFPVLWARIGVCLTIKIGVDRLIEAERQRVMLESVGAACHHISQPMTSVLGTIHLMKHKAADDPKLTEDLVKLEKWANDVAEILDNLHSLSTYRTEPYIAGRDIIDITPAIRVEERSKDT